MRGTSRQSRPSTLNRPLPFLLILGILALPVRSMATPTETPRPHDVVVDTPLRHADVVSTPSNHRSGRDFEDLTLDMHDGYSEAMLDDQEWQTTAWEEKANLPNPIVPDGAATLANGFTYIIDGLDAYYATPDFDEYTATIGPPDYTSGPVVSNGRFIWAMNVTVFAPSYYSSVLDGGGGALNTWQQTASLGWGILPPLSQEVVATSSYMYQIGGQSRTWPYSVSPGVSRTAIHSDGRLNGSWEYTTDLPEPRGNAHAIATRDWLYVIGGYGQGCGPNNCNYVGTVFYGHVEADGSIASWNTGPELPLALSDFATQVVDDAIYVIGGQVDGELSDRVYRAEIQDDGSLREWEDVPHLRLGSGRYGHSATMSQWHIHVIGGTTEAGVTASVEAAVPTYHLEWEIRDRLLNDPETLLGRTIFIRAMPLDTFDPSFGLWDEMEIVHFVADFYGTVQTMVVLVATNPVHSPLLAVDWPVVLLFWTSGHLISTLHDSRAQFYYGVEPSGSGGAITAVDLPDDAIPLNGLPYIMHGTIRETVYHDWAGDHALYYFDLEDEGDFRVDMPSLQNPRFPVRPDSQWIRLQDMRSSAVFGQDYATLGWVSARYNQGLYDVVQIGSTFWDTGPIYVQTAHGVPLPVIGEPLIVSGQWSTAWPSPVVGDPIPSTPMLVMRDDDEFRCIRYRIGGCITSVVENTELSGLQVFAASTGSPVDTHLFDNQGRHTGMLYDSSGNPVGVETAIPTSYFFPGDNDDHEIVLVNGLQGSDFEIRVQGTGTGSYSLGQIIQPSEPIAPSIHSVSMVATVAGQIDSYAVEGLPEPPTSIRITQQGPSRIEVLWTESTDPSVVGYYVYLKEGESRPGATHRATMTPVTGSSLVVESIDPGIDHLVGVVSVTSAGIESAVEEWVPVREQHMFYLPAMLKHHGPPVSQGWQEVGLGSASGGGISNTSVYSAYPSAACGSDGTCYVAWMEYRSGTPEDGNHDIYVRRWNGSVWEEVGAGSASGGGISNNSGRSTIPSIAIDPTGIPYVAWDDNTRGNYEIYVRRWNGSTWEEVGAGSASGGGISNNSGDSRPVRLAFDPAGTVYATWHDTTPGGREVYVRRWNGSIWEEVGAGSATGSGISGSPPGVWSAFPSIAFAPDGTGYIAWRERYDGSGYTEIYVRRWNGSVWEEVGAGSASGVGISNTPRLSQEPSIAVGFDGIPYVAWHDNSAGDDEIYVRRWNGSTWEEVGAGSASGGGISNDSGGSWRPKVAVGSSRIPYVVWSDNSNGNEEIYVRRWNETTSSWEEVDAGSASGSGISDNVGVSTVPALAVADNGAQYVFWADNTSGNFEIYVLRHLSSGLRSNWQLLSE